MAFFSFTTHPETSVTTLSCDQLKDLVDSMPSAFELGELLTVAERPRFIGYKFLPDEAIRAAFEIAKARGEPDFGFAAVETYLDEVERLKPLTDLVQAFEGVKMHLEDHLARLRSPAAQETLAEYASLQGRARIRGDAKLRQQIARLADLIPPAGDHRPSQREKPAPTPAPAE